MQLVSTTQMWNIEHKFSRANGWNSLDMDLCQVEICALLHLVVLIPPVNSGNDGCHFVQSFLHYLEYIQVFFCVWYSFQILIYIMYIMHITVCIYDFVPVMSLTEDQCCTETWCTISLVLSLYTTVGGNLMQISITHTICLHLFC